MPDVLCVYFICSHLQRNGFAATWNCHSKWNNSKGYENKTKNSNAMHCNWTTLLFATIKRLTKMWNDLGFYSESELLYFNMLLFNWREPETKNRNLVVLQGSDYDKTFSLETITTIYYFKHFFFLFSLDDHRTGKEL